MKTDKGYPNIEELIEMGIMNPDAGITYLTEGAQTEYKELKSNTSKNATHLKELFEMAEKSGIPAIRYVVNEARKELSDLLEITNKDGHKYTKSWVFVSEEERDLANAVAAYMEKNGKSINDATQVFPYVARMLGGKEGWAK